MRVVYLLMALAGIHSLVSIVQAAQGEDFMLFGFVRPANGARASGMLVNPNHLAGFLEIVGVMGLSVAWWSGRRPAVKIVAGYATVFEIVHEYFVSKGRVVSQKYFAANAGIAYKVPRP